MAAYMIGLGRIKDHDRFARYLEEVVPTLDPHGGKLLALEDPAEVMEGDAPYPRVVLLEFPSKQHVRDWKKSPEYTAAAVHRLASSEHVFYLVDEFVMPTGERSGPGP